MEKLKYIGVAGNIGAGKTTLCKKLSEHFNWEVQYESTENNPYLSDFYEDMQRWSFNLQVYFLHSRYEHLLKILDGSKTIIQDRTIYEDAYIFATNLHSMGLMATRDFETYQQLFELMTSRIQAPDLLIYLRSSIPNLMKHIHKRGRDYEGNISLDYLNRLNQRYEEWIADYSIGNIITIDVDEIDFDENLDDLQKVIQAIEGQINTPI